jgi:DnaJ family protein C protein 9
MEHIMAHVPHTTYEDESRVIGLVKKLIKSKKIASLPGWEASIKDEKAKKERKKRGEKEAQEAEETAKELGVWDEFYGSGEKGKRGTGKQAKEDSLQALIQRRAADRSTGGFLDALAAKYGAMEDDPLDAPPKRKGKKRAREGEEELPSKRRI